MTLFDNGWLQNLQVSTSANFLVVDLRAKKLMEGCL